jgi:hypothetical protein
MGSFTYSIGDDVRERFPATMPFETKAVVAAELRGRGLNWIAASLEGNVGNQACGVQTALQALTNGSGDRPVRIWS